MNYQTIKNTFQEKSPLLYYSLSLIIHPRYHINKTYEKIRQRYLYYKLPKLQHNALVRLKNKSTIKCVFFVVQYQGWKYDVVYKLMVKNSRFCPVILICPSVNFGRETMLMHLRDSFNYFKSRNYNVINSYDEEKDKYVDVLSEVCPDIIFYTNPYEGLIDDRYYITNFLETLTVYVPYAFNNNIDHNFCQNLPLHNYVWRYYAESDEHRLYSLKYSNCKGRNVVTTGYPGIESFLDNNYKCRYDDWKIRDNTRKRIIWAPHHTIVNVGKVNYSCFLQYADFMLEMVDKYKNDVQFVFKPHPLLKDRLESFWGKEKTIDYYSKWEKGVNCSFCDGDYVDLFFSSDAMIHDSGSFLIEYLYLNKPVMRTINDIPLEKMYNSFALKCLEQHYFAQSKHDIEQFIQNVISEIDPLKEQRTKFVNEVLMPKGSPSQNIINDILDSIDNQILYRN